MSKILAVQHECNDGWHKFTSQQVPGLYVLAKQEDLEAVYSEIPTVLEALIKADFNHFVKITPQESYSEYIGTLPASHLPSVQHFIIERLAA